MPSILPALVASVPGLSVTRPEVARAEDALRRGPRDARVGGFLPRLQRYGTGDQADNDNAAALGADGSPSERRRGHALTPALAEPSGDSAPFLAQVIGQDEAQPKETPLDPFGEATQAYARRAGSEETALVLDTPIKVDFNV